MSGERVEILRRTFRDGVRVSTASWTATLVRTVHDYGSIDVVALVIDETASGRSDGGGFVHIGRTDWADHRTVTLTEWEYVR